MFSNWHSLKEFYSARGYDGINEILKISEEDGEYFLQQLLKLQHLSDLKELFILEEEQEKLGAGFCGVLSSPLPAAEKFDIGQTEQDFFRAVLLLIRSKKAALQQIKDKMPYPLSFQGQDLHLPPVKAALEGEIELKTKGIKRLLSYLKDPSGEDVHSLVREEAFQEMLTHRHSLGYIPEPVINEEGLARMFTLGASTRPVPEIWKWLNPQNFFDTADLYLNASSYKQVLRVIEENWQQIERVILSVLAGYAPSGFQFKDSLTLAVGWGIRGWATQSTAGVNIEFFKDNYEAFLTCAIHELFHRFQAAVCPRGEGHGFQALLTYPGNLDEKHKKLYQVLTYIFLEGTAEFACKGLFGISDPDMHGVEQGLNLLEKIHRLVSEGEEKKVEEMVNKGLISNGPFYQLGEYMARRISVAGDQKLKETFLKGSPAFFRLFFNLQGSYDIPSLQDSLKMFR